MLGKIAPLQKLRVTCLILVFDWIIDQRNLQNLPRDTSTRTEPVIIENMVVGPEVQTLTVFKERDIKLANGLDVQIVAGHQFANNSSTQKWRRSYCYVTWTDELSIRVDLATKPGKEASVINGYILPNELEMLGGIRKSIN